ncbi:hypothetical protein H4R34_001635 [Dimargaris verticillata]|uniref:Uncharacterized protein n=1 Tax=Dimargaris verticillata TaxID=2761393 RepID=A0A9W8B553_9FUNG|nr:hypothetical protein H4R34_001635 [Dimargaris verticillata]
MSGNTEAIQALTTYLISFTTRMERQLDVLVSRVDENAMLVRLLHQEIQELRQESANSVSTTPAAPLTPTPQAAIAAASSNAIATRNPSHNVTHSYPPSSSGNNSITSSSLALPLPPLSPPASDSQPAPSTFSQVQSPSSPTSHFRLGQGTGIISRPTSPGGSLKSLMNISMPDVQRVLHEEMGVPEVRVQTVYATLKRLTQKMIRHNNQELCKELGMAVVPWGHVPRSRRQRMYAELEDEAEKMNVPLSRCIAHWASDWFVNRLWNSFYNCTKPKSEPAETPRKRIRLNPPLMAEPSTPSQTPPPTERSPANNPFTRVNE